MYGEKRGKREKEREKTTDLIRTGKDKNCRRRFDHRRKRKFSASNSIRALDDLSSWVEPAQRGNIVRL